MKAISWRVLSGIRGTLITPAIISSVLVLPFMVLELVNRRALPGAYPAPLFVFMWLLPFTFTVILMPIARRFRARNGDVAMPRGHLARVALLIVIAWLWVGLVADQMPCFLGVPNCD